MRAGNITVWHTKSKGEVVKSDTREEEPMKIFVAGASGAIGQPLIAELLRHGHTVTGMTQSEAGAKRLIEQGATAEVANVLDVSSVESALRRSQAEVVIDELTSLPKNPADLPAALPGDRRLRLEGGGNLHRAAVKIGIRRYIQQSSGFFLKAGTGLADVVLWVLPLMPAPASLPAHRRTPSWKGEC